MTKLIKPEDFVSFDGTEQGTSGLRILTGAGFDPKKCTITVDEETGLLCIKQKGRNVEYAIAPGLWSYAANPQWHGDERAYLNLMKRLRGESA